MDKARNFEVEEPGSGEVGILRPQRMSIDEQLFRLLHEHDCVIVPRWGGFLLQYRSARLDQAQGIIHPPGKEVGFNKHLLRNDGLLLDKLAVVQGLDHAAALIRLEAEVAVWQQKLDQHGRVEVPRIGIFYRDAEGNLQFDPDERTNFLKDAFGLRPVPALIPAKEVERVIPIKLRKETSTGTEKESSWMMAAAASALVLLGAAGVWGALSQVSDTPAWNAALPWGSTPAMTYSPSEELPVLHTEASVFELPEMPYGVHAFPLPGADGLTVTVDYGALPAVAPKDSTRVELPRATTVRARYHVIGGCFAQPENADRLLEDLQNKGFPAVRLAKHGALHPVAFGSFLDRATALAQLERIRGSHVGQAWLLVR